MGEPLKFLTLIVNINLVLQVDNKLYPQIYLNECFMNYKFCTKNLTLNESDNENDNDNENENKQENNFSIIYKNELLSI